LLYSKFEPILVLFEPILAFIPYFKLQICY
jgi:hypothetical protein